MGVDKRLGSERKRWILSIRTNADGRQRLVESAESNARSLSEEIEWRLQKTYQVDDFVGGPANAAFIDLIGVSIREVEAATGSSWRTNASVWRLVREKIIAELDAREPSGNEAISGGPATTEVPSRGE